MTSHAPSASRMGTKRDHNAFLEYFATHEAQDRAKKQKETLSVEQHAAHRAQLTTVLFIKPRYAHETQVNVCGIFKKWQRYCSEMKVGDWKATIENLKRETTQDFFLFICEKYNISSWSTGKVYIRQFQQLYTTLNGRYMDRNDSKEVYKYYNSVLIPRFDHQPPNKDGKPVFNVDSLRLHVTFNIAFDMKTFPGERHRLNMHGCYQLLCYTGARPAELVNAVRSKPKDGSGGVLFGCKAVHSTPDDDADQAPALDKDSKILDDLLAQETVVRGRPKALCYEDIQMMIVRHPITKRCILAMAIKFIHHKGADNKPKPTIFYFTPAKKLAFCAVSTILALALHDEAFDAPSLINASSVFSKAPPRFKECLPLRWKISKLKIPIFRRYHGHTLSADEPMEYTKLRDDMGQQSLDLGNEKKTTPRFARRGTANAVNGDAPDPVRDQMMRHDPAFLTFQNAYLNEILNFDVQNAFLEEEKETELFRMFAYVSLTRDPRATANMVPPEVWENTPPDPEIIELERQLEELRGGRYRIEGHEHEKEIRQLKRTIDNKCAHHKLRVVKRYREFFFYNAPTWDVERQARGEEEEEYVEPEIDVSIPERARLAKLLCKQPDDWTEEEVFQQRIKAIDLMVALCGKRETVRRKHIQQKARTTLPIKVESPGAEYRSTPNSFPLLMEATQCPDCFGDERLSLEERKFLYCRPTVRNDHFDDCHLPGRERVEHRGEPIRCEHPRCKDEKFKHLDHFRSHVQNIHGVTLRSSVQVRDRRWRKARHRQMVKGNR
ncbi:hypothetical protein B0T10DRAFT_520891 [Thelonectria olida]|uniref:FluG domain-containing protein n=1 Tax=Thelonectria olida TaxID=1576542 RepID=A0A9P8VUD0_9HYPO|nr:hypothetical protein B0T10DRAFT_520891 [Thelonectria olida]